MKTYRIVRKKTKITFKLKGGGTIEVPAVEVTRERRVRKR